ncbi:MAG: hypothetical protein WCK13_06075 [Ignavibacteriota bacterium]
MNIKRSALFVILITVISCNVFAQFAIQYKNVKHNYGINLPKTLELTELPASNNCDTLVCKDKDGSEMSITAKSDQIYKGINGGQLSSKSFMPDLKARLKNIELAETYTMDISGEPALYMKVNFKNDDMDGVVSQFILIKNGKIYILRLVSTKDNNEKFSAEISGYLFTFQFFESTNRTFYKNELYNFVIYFPTGWNFDKGSFPVQANSSKGTSISVEVLKNNEYEGMTSNDLDEDTMVDALKSQFTNVSLVGKKKYTIDGHPVLMLKYKWVQVAGGKNDATIVMHYYLIKKNMMFIIEGKMKEGTKDDERLIEQAVQSFQFTK